MKLNWITFHLKVILKDFYKKSQEKNLKRKMIKIKMIKQIERKDKRKRPKKTKMIIRITSEKFYYNLNTKMEIIK